MAVPLSTSYQSPEIIVENFSFSALTHQFILANSTVMPDSGDSRFFSVFPELIGINIGSFNNPGGALIFPDVLVQYRKGTLMLNCGCSHSNLKFCTHQAQVLYNIMERHDLRLFFDADLRHKKIIAVAANYGLENEINPDEHFVLNWANRCVTITPRLKSLLPVTAATLLQLSAELIASPEEQYLKKATTATKLILVFSQHKYYQHLQISLYQATVGMGSKIKNPLNSVDPLSLVWVTSDAAEIKFYTAINSFNQQTTKPVTDTNVNALRAIVNNPLKLDTYYHDPKKSDNITALSVVPVQLNHEQIILELSVYLKNDFYEINGQLLIGETVYLLDQLRVKYGCFIFRDNQLQWIGAADLIRVISYFKQHNNIIVVHQSKFEAFRKTILAKLENKIRIHYSWLVAATKEQLAENGFDASPQRIIYLSDSDNQVMISPVMRYGEMEVSILSKAPLYARDQKGNTFIAERDEAAELAFTRLLLQQHPEFETQLYQEAFYVTKKQLLETGWFLELFETWEKHQIKILGFNEITNNKLNPNKGKITVKVTSGLDWFDTDLDVRYGKQKVSLKQLHKAVKNGSKFVPLDDGTLGMLPAEWIQQMAAYFEAGEIKEETIITPRINFSSVATIYTKEMLSVEVKDQLELYSKKLSHFESIASVAVPVNLQANLRSYQQQGLNWLNFLDDFGFGGCLADDMGLGKTVQIIAFILLLKIKRGQQTHLIVVPTSLIFNWQQELEKFAPSLKIHTIQPNSTVKNNHSFSTFDAVLTSYGMLVSKLHFLRTYSFSYIFLDESQAIKNPDSQRYKAARLLHSTNKIVLTGTPVENNSFDLYGQLSFACPGLLGNQQYFKDVYSQPIDKFGDNKRAAALQQKVNPFILRRTKKQVAAELPEKTEMVIYCEMGTEQRKVYDAYEKEFRNYLLHQPEEDLPRETMHVLQGLTKLRQICNSPALLKDQPYYGDASAKIAVLVEQIQNKSKEHKILVFSQFVGMLDLIKKELAAKYITYEWLTGQTTNREAVVDNFQNNPDIRVFLISLKAGGIGLNLTAADYVYLVDPWWNPAVENQAIDRCHRIGQQKHVVAIRLICPDTIEEKIMQLQASKKELVNDLIKTDQSVIKQLSKLDLIQLLERNTSIARE